LSGSRFRDRSDAGQQLAAALSSYASTAQCVLGLPRGGVPVAAEVAEALSLPLDVVIVRKLGVPGHEELAMGAVASAGGDVALVVNSPVRASSRISEAEFEAVRLREEAEVRRRAVLLRGDRPRLELSGTVLLIDDGLATGSTMLAALQALLAVQPDLKIVLGAPVGSADTVGRLRALVADVVCCRMPEPFYAVGQAYNDFEPTSDAEVRSLLHRYGRRDRL
jgi:putative phosphoribosyl transferase